MTCLASASALVDAFVDSGSFLRTQVSACDFGVIDTGGGACGIVIHPGVSNLAPTGYAGVSTDNWGYVVNGFIRTGNDPVEDLGRVYDMHDAMAEVFMTSTCINTGPAIVKSVTITHDPLTVWDFGGPICLLVRATVMIEDP